MLRETDLENPADALRILAAVSSDDPSRRPVPEPSADDGRQNGWKDWEAVREGKITAQDAASMFILYVQPRKGWSEDQLSKHASSSISLTSGGD